MTTGWVRLNRQLFDNDLWLSEPFNMAQAWIDLFANANHKDTMFVIRGNKIQIKRGQIGWSEVTMSKRWKWSRGRVRRFLKYLETEQQIEQQKLYKLTSIITICNYEKYQSDTTDSTTDGQQTDNRRYTDKNDKNDKNDKKTQYGEFKNVYFTTEEHIKLCERYGRGAVSKLVEDLSTYLKSSGSRYKDHYATILNWARRKAVVEVSRGIAPAVIAEKPLSPDEQAKIRGRMNQIGEKFSIKKTV